MPRVAQAEDGDDVGGDVGETMTWRQRDAGGNGGAQDSDDADDDDDDEDDDDVDRCDQCGATGVNLISSEDNAGAILGHGGGGGGDDEPRKQRFCNNCMLGKKIRVFWPVDETWYTGTVEEYDEKTGEHRLRYFDGDAEWVRVDEALAFAAAVGGEKGHGAAAAMEVLGKSKSDKKKNRRKYGSSKYDNKKMTMPPPEPATDYDAATDYVPVATVPVATIKADDDDKNKKLPPAAGTGASAASDDGGGVAVVDDGGDGDDDDDDAVKKTSDSNGAEESHRDGKGEEGGGGGEGRGRAKQEKKKKKRGRKGKGGGDRDGRRGKKAKTESASAEDRDSDDDDDEDEDDDDDFRPFPPLPPPPPPLPLPGAGYGYAIPPAPYYYGMVYPPLLHGMFPGVMPMTAAQKKKKGGKEKAKGGGGGAAAAAGADDDGSGSGKKGRGSGRLWTKEEDAALLDHVDKMGNSLPIKWSRIAKSLGGRTGKQCRERYLNHLNPSLKASDWTPFEDAAIFQLHSTIGTSWSHMSKIIRGRADNAIKNRFHYLRRQYERDDENRLRGTSVTQRFTEEIRNDRMLRKFPDHLWGKNDSALWDMTPTIGVLAAQSVFREAGSKKNSHGDKGDEGNPFGPYRGAKNGGGEACVRCGLLVPSVHTGRKICSRTGWCLTCTHVPPHISGNLLRHCLNLRREQSPKKREIIESWKEYFTPSASSL